MKLQKCINCAYYTAYYKIQNHGFERSNACACSKHKKVQTQFETCEFFKDNAKKEKTRKDKLFISLEYALKSINEITQILSEIRIED